MVKLVKIEEKRPIHPKPSNFAGYMSAVEDLLLEQSGLNRGNASEASLMEISEKAKGFTKRIRLVWDKFHGKPKRILEKASEIEVNEQM